MKRSKKTRLKKLLSILSLVLGVAVILVSITRAKNMEYIYDLPEGELQEVLLSGQYITSSLDISMDGQLSSRQHWLTGACPIGTLSSREPQAYTIELTRTMGQGKVAFSSHGGELVLWEPTDDNRITLDGGSYDVYCVGKHFWGSVTIAAVS